MFRLLCFELLRIIFIVFNMFYGFSCSFSEFLGTLWHGFRLDLATTSYIGVFVIPFFIIFSFIRSTRAFRIFIDIITSLLLVGVLLISVGDAEVYRSWQFRIDGSVVMYLSNPDLMLASVSSWRLVMLFAFVAILGVGLFMLYRLFTRRLFDSLSPEKFYSLFFILVAGLLVIPARGGIGIVPINVGSVYFSENLFVNHSAINVCWNFGSAFFKSENDFEKYMFYDDEFDLPCDTIPNNFHEKKVLNKTPDHIVFVLLESFTWTAMNYDNPAESVTPKLISWRDKGIFFSKFYASGDRSVRGIASIFSGTPSLPEYSVIKHPEKTQRMPSLLKTLKNNGYNDVSFYYGGDVNFANMNSYFCQNGVERIVAQNNLNIDCRQSKWGYDDECMFEIFYNDLQILNSKSVSILFTLDSHEPYDVPISPYGDKDELSRSMNAYYYTDSCLNLFLKRMEKSPMWENTLIVLVSDHGKLYRTQNWASLDKSHIIMQWLGGTVAENFECNLPADQSDIPSTLLSVLGISADDFPFSQNIFGAYKPSVFASFGKSCTYIEDDKETEYDTDNDSFAPQNTPEYLQKRCKEYCQKVAEYYAGLK